MNEYLGRKLRSPRRMGDSDERLVYSSPITEATDAPGKPDAAIHHRFSDKLWDGMEVMEKLTNSSKRSCDSYVKFLSAEQSLHATYCRKLENCVSSMGTGLVEPLCSTEQHMGACLRDMEAAISEEEGKLNALLKRQVCSIMEEDRNTMVSRNKRLLAKASEIEKDKSDSSQKLLKSKSKYFKCCEDLLNAKAAVDQARSNDSTPETISSLSDRVQAKYKEKVRLNQAYMEAVKFARTVQRDGDAQLRQILDAFQAVELNRLQSLKGSVETYLALKLSKLQAEQRMVEDALSRVQTEFSPTADVQMFIRSYSTYAASPSYPEYKDYDDFQREEQHQDEPEEVELHNDFDTEEFKEYEEFWIQWFDTCVNWSENCQVPCDISPHDSLETALSHPTSRKAFVSVLNSQRNFNGSGGQLRSMFSFQEIARAMNVCLDSLDVGPPNKPHAHREVDLRISVPAEPRDISPAKIIMIMSQTLFLLPEVDGERLYLQSIVKDHSLWKTPRFWEEMFFDSFWEEMNHGRVVQLQKWMTNDEAQEIKRSNGHVVFGQLGSFAHSMFLFGLDRQTVEEFVRKMSRIHDLDETFQEQILCMVENDFD